MATLEERYQNYFGEDNLVAQQLMNEYNNESAIKQQDFQEYMSSTAHQREVSDLLAAGLNPVLSANAGAPAMTGAYAEVDSSPTSAALQKKMQEKLQENDLANQRKMQSADFENQRHLQSVDNKNQLKMQANALKNEQIINKYSVDKNYKLGMYQAKVGAAATRYAAGAAASAARYGAAASAAAAKYGYDLNYKNSEAQRSWDAKHPNNPYQAGGTILEGIKNILPSASSVKKSYSPGNSSAK